MERLWICSWKYLAGLFDGDGNPCIYLMIKKTGSPSLGFRMAITGTKEGFIPIKIFLKENGIYAGIHKGNKVHKRKDNWRQNTTYRLTIGSFDGIKKFCEMIYPYIHLKRKQVEIMLQAIALKEKIKKERKFLKDNFHLFDELRHELHKLSRKGPRKLKPWNTNNRKI